MLTLNEIWNDELVGEPFLARNVDGFYFLCTTKVNDQFFSGVKVERMESDGGYKFSSEWTFPGSSAVWELVNE